MFQCPAQTCFIMLLQPDCKKSLLRQPIFQGLTSQQITAQNRSQSKSHYSRSKQGYNKGNSQRNQHTSFHSTQEKQRNKADYNNQSRIQDRHTYFTGSIEDNLTYRTALCHRQHSVFTQMLPYVFYIHDGIIDQRTDSNSHTSQTHGIDTKSHVVKYQNRYH